MDLSVWPGAYGWSGLGRTVSGWRGGPRPPRRCLRRPIARRRCRRPGQRRLWIRPTRGSACGLVGARVPCLGQERRRARGRDRPTSGRWAVSYRERARAGNAYVILDDLGKARRGFVSPRNGWETHPKLPLTLHRSDLHGPWDWQPLGRRESRFGRGAGRSRKAARRPQERDRQRQGVEVQLPRPIQVPDPYWL